MNDSYSKAMKIMSEANKDPNVYNAELVRVPDEYAQIHYQAVLYSKELLDALIDWEMEE